MSRVSKEARTLLLADAKAGCSVDPADAINLLADLADAEALVERLKEQIELAEWALGLSRENGEQASLKPQKSPKPLKPLKPLFLMKDPTDVYE